MSHSSNDQYSSLQSMRRWSNTSHPDDGFNDLHHQDFIWSVGQVSHHKLDQLEIHPYQKGLLCCGVVKHVQEEEGSSDLPLSMEYSGAVGMMLIDDC